MQLLEFQKLKIVRFTKHGAYLDETGDSYADSGAEPSPVCMSAHAKREPQNRPLDSQEVLLPQKELPPGAKEGDTLDVFIYLDSSDRPTATLRRPLITQESFAVLEVTELTPIGAFLDWGLDKDLLLPFKEQTEPVTFTPGGNSGTRLSQGDRVPVKLYIDKSGRPAASMRIYNDLVSGGGYIKDSAVEGTVIQINPDMGVFVAVDDKYFGMIPIREIHQRVSLGDKVYGRVSLVRDDGKYMISLTQKSHIQMDEDAQAILDALEEAGGSLPFGDKSDAEAIKQKFHMSKAAFKRAVGSLYKNKKIIPGAEEIKLNITEI